MITTTQKQDGVSEHDYDDLNHAVKGLGKALREMEEEQLELGLWERAESQDEELTRCKSKLGTHILDFLNQRGIGQEFYASELYIYCESKIPRLAPASPDRVLRQLSADGRVSYTVVNRRNSQYRIDQLKDE